MDHTNEIVEFIVEVKTRYSEDESFIRAINKFNDINKLGNGWFESFPNFESRIHDISKRDTSGWFCIKADNHEMNSRIIDIDTEAGVFVKIQASKGFDASGIFIPRLLTKESDGKIVIEKIVALDYVLDGVRKESDM